LTGRLFVISGPTAAGKTTVGRALAGLLPRAVHLDGDVFQRFVVSGSMTMDIPPPPGATEQLWLRYRAALSVAAIYRRAGFDAVLTDNIFEAGWGTFLTLAHASESASTTAAVMLTPHLDAIRARYQERPGGGYTDSMTPEHLLEAVARTPRIGLWLDTSGQTASESATEILRRVDEATVSIDDLKSRS
jgi:energy-coupling factor transporter ATP-binding protein EcfA2